MKKHIGVQLYSVRRELGHDFKGTLEKIAAMGYDGVELAGLPGGVTPSDAVKLLASLKLEVVAAHTGLPIGENKIKVIDNAKALGATTIVCGKGPDDFKTIDLVKKSCAQFSEAAANAANAGLRLALHNHWWEFGKVEGRVVFDMMRELLDPRVLFEVDTYWVKTGGGDPVSVIRSLGKRAPLLHIKDGPCKLGQPMLAAGKGSMDFPPILKVANHAEWLVVELDECATDMLDAVRDSLKYLKTIVTAQESEFRSQ